MHGYTGAYDKVSLDVGAYVRAKETRPAPKPLYDHWNPPRKYNGSNGTNSYAPSSQTIEILKQRGYLTEMAEEEEENRFHHIADTLHRQSIERSPNYIFMPNYDCNLRCPYCFQDHMRTDTEYSHLLHRINMGTIDRIFSAMDKIEKLHNLDPHNENRMRKIGFFGGEPLLAKNRPIIHYIMNKARATSGQQYFWAVSNATELDVYADELGPSGIEFIQITLDGPPDEHDKRRVYPDGSGSFEKIARNISLSLDKGVRVSIRMNIDRHNIHQLPDLAEEIQRRGWHTYKKFSTYTAPIHGTDGKTEGRTTLTSWQLDTHLDKMRAELPVMSIIRRPDEGLVGHARSLFAQRNEPILHSNFCGAHNSMYIFDAFGDIYSCWEKTGDKRIRIGRVTHDGDMELNALSIKWRSRNVTTNPVCRRCRYALYCGGGCAVLAAGRTNDGNMFTNFCDGYSARFRTAVAEAYLDHVAGVASNIKEERLCDV